MFTSSPYKDYLPESAAPQEMPVAVCVLASKLETLTNWSLRYIGFQVITFLKSLIVG